MGWRELLARHKFAHNRFPDDTSARPPKNRYIDIYF